MMHSAQSSWTASGDVFSTAAPVQLSAAPAADSIQISGLSTTALVEPTAPGEMVAMTTRPSFAQIGAQPQPTDLYSPDVLVLALGLVGAWMLVVGSALTVRQLRLVKVSKH